MPLYVEKQTAYSNAPIGRDIQTWSEVIRSIARRESWAYLNISAILWVHVEQTYPGIIALFSKLFH